MSPGRRSFNRPTGIRPQRKLFLIATEGEKTEPKYFYMFNTTLSTAKILCLKGGHASSPPKVLKRMANWLNENDLKIFDEAWIVVDKDQWSDSQIEELSSWAKSKENYGLALSNPKFEYWLLLHFEDGVGIRSSRDCSDRLKKHIPGYDKDINASKFTNERIDQAILRSEKGDNPPSIGWPKRLGSTTVYRLVKRIPRP